ncbi:36974_t:CDS:2, partial [Racocetra persica]
MDRNIKTISGSYTKFINWLESLVVENEPLPKGLLFLAFDNKQRGQFNYLDRGHNTVIYHTVTSFIALNMNKNDYAQFKIVSWICDLISDDQYEKLYYILPEMQAEHDLKLKIYISSILEELVIEKNKKINTIDTAIKNQKGVEGQSKWCKKCNTTNIDNKKYNCPQCNKKLDTLAALQAEFANENVQLLAIIDSLLNLSDRPKYRGLQQKSHSQ